MHIPLATLLVFSMALLCALPIRGSPASVLRDYFQRMEKDIEELRGLLVTIEETTITLKFGDDPMLSSYFIKASKIISDYSDEKKPPWPEFPSAEILCYVTPNDYNAYQKIYEDYKNLFATAMERCNWALKRMREERAYYNAAVAKYAAIHDGSDDDYYTASEGSPYIFRSTQASTVLMDPRAETLSVTFHNGPSIGSAAASNAGIANGCIVAQPDSNIDTCK
ncbi:hypothetical protein SeLEV6574_g07110 [Synchytrium endobioticum]|nr:hypothetical protein SeLEV6574_g07110 [Synchytrium endobioticum]